MINPEFLAFDIDGVVADTMTLFIKIAQEEHDINLKYEDITHYILEDCLNMDSDVIWEVINKLLDGSHDSYLNPIKGSIDVLNRLGQNCTQLNFVTARPNLDPIHTWMHNMLSVDNAKIDIVATGSFEAKAEVLLNKKISWFVEDRLETCFLLKDAGINPVVFIQPWNRKQHPFIEVGSWQEIESLIEFS